MKINRNQFRFRKDRALRGFRAYHWGLWAEAFCRLALRLKGYRIVTSRLRTPMGEIDLVVTRGAIVALVEVKARPSRDAALTSVAPAQRQRLVRAATYLLARYPAFQGRTIRFDVMLVAPWKWPLHKPNAWDASF